MIKLVIFDLGNVLIDFDFSPAIGKLRKNKDFSLGKAARLFRDSTLAERWDKGLLSSEEFYGEIQKELHLPLKMEEFVEIWNDIFTEKKDMIETARLLNKKIKVVICSNTNPWHADYVRKKYPWIKEFELIASCDVKMMKPDPEIYEMILHQAGTDASETFYVDDIQKYVTAAKKLGIDAVLFENVPQILHEIRKRKLDSL